MEATTTAEIEVEVAVAWPDLQRLVRLRLAAGSTAAAALAAAGFGGATDIGIFGRRVTADRVLRAGDRVEVYRPLVVDPKQARRRRARSNG